MQAWVDAGALVLLSVVGQKGGIGKSTIARLLAVEAARSGYSVELADLDAQQQSSYRWAQRRADAEISPVVASRVYRTTGELSGALGGLGVVVVDGAPHASRATQWLAEHSSLTVLPTGQSVDDLEPTVRLGLELIGGGLPRERLCVVVTRTTGSHHEVLSTASSLREAQLPFATVHLPLSTGYAQAQDLGRAVSETRHPTLNARADRLAQQLFDRLTEAANG